MKLRIGFVSNSSSSCFILDYKNPEVKKLLKGINVQGASDVGRSTSMAIGKDAIKYAEDWLKECEDWYDNSYDCLGNWILRWAKELGEDNVVFLRESDECMGGSLFGGEEGQYSKNPKIVEKYKKLHELKLDEIEYH